MEKPIKVALGSVPKDGGTFTFYRNQRPELLKLGVDLRCVSTGKNQARLWNNTFADEGCILLAGNSFSVKKQSQAFVNWCMQEEIDIVIGINSEAILSSFPHLPDNIRVIARSANAFDHGYKITMSGRDRLMRIVALTPRLKNDLIASYGANPNIIELIPNGIEPLRFEAARNAKRGNNYELRIGFLGRLEHNQKGVLHIPKIVDELKVLGVPYLLTIAGTGKHEAQLKQELSNDIKDGSVIFVGPLAPDDVPQFFSNQDIYLFTSHFEGCPNALLEAIIAGCVPVSWLIEGITDFIIENEHTGFIAKTADYSQMANYIFRLHKNRDGLQKISNKVSSVALKRFTNVITSNAYAKMFKKVMTEDSPQIKVLPWSSFEGDPNFQHRWTEIIPPEVKTTLVKISKLFRF